MEATTLFNDTTEFKARPVLASTPREPAKGISTRPRARTRKDAEDVTGDELFETDYVQDDHGQVGQLQDLMRRHSKVISVTRPGTAVMQKLFLRMQQLLRGEFLFAYTWDRQWFNRVAGKYPVELLRFNGWDELVQKVDDVLSYVEERQQYGYWYPSKREGKVCKDNLADFLAKPMRDGNWWSVFVELACGDAVTPSMYRSMLGPDICRVLDGMLDRAWFNRDFDTMVKFYRGVADLRKWLNLNGNALRKVSAENNYNLSSFEMLLDRVRLCNDETGCVGPNFIGPWSNRWSVLTGWLKRSFGVKV